MKISSSPNECETSLKFTTLSTTKSDLDFLALVDDGDISKSETRPSTIFFWTLMTALGVAIFTLGVRAISIYEEIEMREMIIDTEPSKSVEKDRDDILEIPEQAFENDIGEEEIINNNVELLGISQNAFGSIDKNDILEETYESEDFLQMEFAYMEDVRLDHIEENQYDSSSITLDEFEVPKIENEIEIHYTKTEITIDDLIEESEGVQNQFDAIETDDSHLEHIELEESVSNIESQTIQDEQRIKPTETQADNLSRSDEIEMQTPSLQDGEMIDGFKLANWKFYESEEDDEEDLMEQYALEGQSKMGLEAKAAGWAVV
jgi:hypothetical protein